MSTVRLDAVYELIRSRPDLYYKANDLKRGHQHQQTSLCLMHEIHTEGMFITYFELFLCDGINCPFNRPESLQGNKLISTVLLCLQIM